MQVYARQLGFSTFVVGTIYTILPILGLISKPLFGALADRYVVWIIYQCIQHCIVLLGRMSYQRIRSILFYSNYTINECSLPVSLCICLAISGTNQCSCFSLFWRPCHFSPFNLFQRYRNQRRSTSIVTMRVKHWNFVQVNWTIVLLIYL